MNGTTMRYIAARQAHGDVVMLVDIVGSFRPDVLRAHGIDTSELLLLQPDTSVVIDETLRALSRTQMTIECVVLNGWTCSADVRQAVRASGLDLIEILPPPTFNLYTQAPGWKAYHVLARGASAWNCVQWICAHANHGDGERLMRAFYALPDGGEEFACAWIVQGGSGEAQVHPDVTIPARFHAAARRAQVGDQ